MRNRLIGALRSVASLLLIAGIAALLWPAAAGGRAAFVRVEGTSMEPAMHTGDLVLVRQVEDYAVGDVVAYRVPAGQFGAGALVIHRIVGTSPKGFVAQGDNKDHVDPWTPTSSDILGRRVLLVPRLAAGFEWLAQPVHLAAVAAAATIVLVLRSRPRPVRVRA